MAWLPEGVKEGTVLRVRFEVDEPRTQEQKEDLQRLLDGLGDQP